MVGLWRTRFQNLVLAVREKLQMDSKTRFMLLLLSFNALLIVIILLSVRNDEIRFRIQEVYSDIEKKIERLATVQAHRVQIVQITATPSVGVVVAVTPTATPVPPTGTPTLPPTATPTATSAPPTPTDRPTGTPLPPTATVLPTTTRPTATAMPTATPPATPTLFPTATSLPPTPAPESASILLTVSFETIAADGSSTTVIRAQVLDQYGHPVPDNTALTFSTDLGAFWGSSTVVVLTVNGIAEATLTSATWAGTATVRAFTGRLSASTAVHFVPVVRITKSVNRSSAPAGGTLWYTILIENRSAGGDAALLRSVQDTLPDGFAYVPGSTSSNPASVFGADPVIAGRVLQWTPVPVPYSLPANSTLELLFQVSVSASAGTYLNSATVRGDNFTSAGTGETASVTLNDAAPTAMTPNAGCNDAPLQATVSGDNFAPGVAARLGAWPLQVTWIDEHTLTVIVPQGIAAGSYHLEVFNPGGSSGVLYNAYTAQNCGTVDTTLESGYLGTLGAELVTSANNGDDDQVQVLFLEVTDGWSGPLYVRIYDPDCGGTLDQQNGLVWDTPFTFTVYGGAGAYTFPDARSAHPGAGVHSGVALATAVFTQEASLDGAWYSMGPFYAADGELVGGKRIFKLGVVAGPSPPFTSGILFADLNLYNVAFSTSPTANTPPAGARIFAFSWTFVIPQNTSLNPPRMFPFVGANVATMVQHNWDYDNLGGVAGITMTTPSREFTVPGGNVSGDGEEKHSGHAVLDTERDTTWAIRCWAQPLSVADNLVTFWATDQNGTPLAIFARSTNGAPP